MNDLILVALAAILIAVIYLASSAAPRTPVPKHALAFYYGWWGTPEGSGHLHHWPPASGAQHDGLVHHPVGGRYDSHDERVLRRHVEEMQGAGITGAICSWWGRNSFDDESLTRLLAVSAATDFAITAYYETVQHASQLSQRQRIDEAVADIIYLIDTFAANRNWLKIGERPVLFIYRRLIHQLGLDGWWIVAQQLKQLTPTPFLIVDTELDVANAPVAAVFSGVHAYNNIENTAGRTAAAIRQWAMDVFPAWRARWSNRVTCLTIMPGFGDDRQPVDDRSVTRRADGETYQALADAAIAANPDWLLICSWNEWHEASEIEPSLEHGRLALDQTKGITRAFLALPSRAISMNR